MNTKPVNVGVDVEIEPEERQSLLRRALRTKRARWSLILSPIFGPSLATFTHWCWDGAPYIYFNLYGIMVVLGSLQVLAAIAAAAVFLTHYTIPKTWKRLEAWAEAGDDE